MSLSVVVPTPRLVCLVCVECGLFTSLRCYPVLLDSGLFVM